MFVRFVWPLLPPNFMYGEFGLVPITMVLLSTQLMYHSCLGLNGQSTHWKITITNKIIGTLTPNTILSVTCVFNFYMVIECMRHTTSYPRQHLGR